MRNAAARMLPVTVFFHTRGDDACEIGQHGGLGISNESTTRAAPPYG
jgi:hypothetical protein